MQGALLTAKGRAVGCEVPRRSEWSNPGLGDFEAVRSKSLRMSNNRVGCCGMVVMKTNQQLARIAGAGWLGSSLNSRSVRLHASGDDLEDVTPLKPQIKSSGTVLPYVGVACLGAILFGYHLGVVNGALEYLAKDLGIVDNTVVQGTLVICEFTQNHGMFGSIHAFPLLNRSCIMITLGGSSAHFLPVLLLVPLREVPWLTDLGGQGPSS